MKAPTDEPAIAALQPWYGSKRTLAQRVVSTLGEHRAYFEPFCGSMSVLLGKPRATMETVNDLHGDLVNLARVIQHPELGPKLYRHLRRVLFCQELWRETADFFRSSDLESVPSGAIDLDRAARFAIFGWFGRNGVVGSNGGVNFCVRYTSNGGSPGKRWVSWVQSIPWFHRRLQGVIILREDGFKLLANVEDKVGTALYCDPPYIAKGAKYTHDFEAADHQRLADALSRFKLTRVVVSYYEHPDLARLYPGWTKINAPTTKAMVQSGKRDKAGRTEAPEVLLVNHVPALFTR